MNISDLCKIIEDSIRSGRYPLDSDSQRQFSPLLQVINRSGTESLEDKDIRIETRVKELFVSNNYTQGIQHLPGVIELDVLDSFKMICRRLERIDSGIKLGKN